LKNNKIKEYRKEKRINEKMKVMLEKGIRIDDDLKETRMRWLVK